MRLLTLMMYPACIGLAVSLCASACSEATDGLIPPDDGGLFGGADDGAVPVQKSSSGGGGHDATTASKSVILINEVSGSKEWVEIVNSGSSEVALEGWAVADTDTTTGGPKLSEAAIFGSGVALGAKEYGLVLGGGLDAGKDCPSGGQVFCVHAEFGISTKKGETLYVLQPDGGVAGTVVYPPDASPSDETWGRIPDGDPKGTFTATPSTPGAPNQ
jgi:hypothetical protein